MSEADRQPPTIPGYTLTTRLGSGGYGEVWLAHAPGGLTKAVKFIYGSFNDRRAELELRSLHRIKSVRHPFLLSLERIEIVDNRLAIVTELADSSLKDRYDECRRAGLPGVPHEELLGFLRDAADALDFLSDRHSLQHLDVKPENLLIVGGHIKVADFGLVKEVGRTQASLVGGLTPLYSSPEVFQGTPGARSDQYSLAVVYQEMLTGRPPFAGATAAELTIQHLQGEPNLAPLPMQDRFAIARALAKDPKQRFASCTEMVEALMEAATGGFANQVAEVIEPERTFDEYVSAFPDRRAEPRPGPVAQFLREGSSAASSPQSAGVWAEPENALPPERRPINVAELAASRHAPPTVVIGVGGLAGRVMRQVRRRLAREIGDDHHATLQMLLLDSDARGISAALHGNDRTALRPEETLAIPLRRPQDYREDSALLMRWLSRRWLYNIPKSLQTEGLRPLGRLAFVDHSRQIGERLAATLEQARRGAAAARDNDAQTSASERVPLRVYVVAGVGGGAGSGMSLDLGYAIRATAQQLGLGEVEVIGLFLHVTGRDARQNELARVNSFAWLREYNHFHRDAGVYPGDEGCGLPAFPAETKAFDAAYFVDLGSVSDDETLDEVASQVAEYLYLDSTTPAHEFFAACRQEKPSSDYAPLRSFRLSIASAADDHAIHGAAVTICRAVLMDWLGCGPNRVDSLPTVAAIDLAGLAGRTREAIHQAISAAASDHAISSSLGEFIRGVDATFVPPDERPGAFVLGRSLEECVAEITVHMAAQLSIDILQIVDERGARLAGASGLLEAWRQRFAQLEAEASKLAAGIAEQATAALVQLQRWQRDRSTADPAREREFGEAYRQLRLDQHAMLAAATIAKRLLAELRTIGDRLGEVSRQIKGFVHQFPQSAALHGDDAFATAITARLPLLTAEVDAQLEAAFTRQMGGLLKVVMGSPRMRDQLAAELTRLATRRAEELSTSSELLAAINLPANSHDHAAVESLQDATLPTVSCLGGAFAMLEMTPSAATEKTAWNITTAGVAALNGVGSHAVRCCEAWNLSLPRIAMNLIDRRPDCIEFADRVSSRCDVDWSPLSQPQPTPLAFPVEEFPVDPSAVTMTQVL